MGDIEVVTLHVEACRKLGSILAESAIKEELEKYLDEQKELDLNKVLQDAILPTHLKYVRFCSRPDDRRKLIMSEHVVRVYHIYQTWDDSPQMDFVKEGNETAPTSLNWCLPNTAFEGLWESLILENDLKDRLMSYVQTTRLYADKQVNAQIIHWNGVILLHGPPGTGKTTLCKALAQKLSIRMSSKYRFSQLIEINSHALFSKWFSESAKLVLKMFTSISQLLQSDDNFICILMDEVESLTHIRQSSKAEPSDSIRVVNAVLTQIDQMKRYPNSLILATSNVSETIDAAFADRADLKLYISLPSVWAIYEIIKTCIEELIIRGLVKGNKNDFFEPSIFKKMHPANESDNNWIINEITENSRSLLGVSDMSLGYSGRTLRKIPLLTSSMFLDKEIPTIKQFLEVMKQVILKHIEENYKLYSGEKKTHHFFV